MGFPFECDKESERTEENGRKNAKQEEQTKK
jgi:hypothetical protein